MGESGARYFSAAGGSGAEERGRVAKKSKKQRKTTGMAMIFFMKAHSLIVFQSYIPRLREKHNGGCPHCVMDAVGDHAVEQYSFIIA
ncbi:MAG: hypothetical protein WDA72_01765 [Desulfomonilia bacterium]|jgi:hypothetical protein|nr:hypothetical protein [Deltaproteobacteria bacterium]MDX9760996.1 hypothetical protein [Desulfomonilia bacterium]HPW68260.1 hypothetical protein [Deltaproteobacteria bacterium]